MARGPRLLRSIGAALTLVVLVVGVPVALWRLGGGWPLPRTMPDPGRVWRALQQGDVPSAVVVRVLASALWVLWAQVAWAIVWEVAVNVPGHHRARRSRPAPVVATPIALGVTRLVSAALLLSVVGGQMPRLATGAAAATAAPPLRPAATATATPGGGARAGAAAARAGFTARDLSPTATGDAVERTAAARVDGQAVGADATTWHVGRGDTLWGIAERALGDGARFADIMALNPMITAPRDVTPGQRLQLPPDAEVPADRRVPAATVEVETGDTLWDLAREHLAADDGAPAPTDAEVAVHVAEITAVNDIESGDPDLIHPGERYRLPAVGTPGPTAPAVEPPAVEPPAASSPAASSPAASSPGDAQPDVTAPDAAPPDVAAPSVAVPSVAAPAPQVAPEPLAAPARAAAPAPAPAAAAVAAAAMPAPLPPPPGAPAATPSEPAEDDAPLVRLVDIGDPTQEAASLLPVGLAGATILATGAVGLLASRRRRQLRAMGVRHRLGRPDPDLALAESALRRGADSAGLARLDTALRSLAAGSAPGDPARPQVVLRHRSGELEVWFDVAPATPPRPPWRSSGDDRRAVLAPTVPMPLLAVTARGVPAPCPALVLLGRAGTTEVYVDLEAIGALVVDGPPGAASAMARAVVASLALSPLADVVDVVACGVDCYGFTRQHRVHTASTCREAVARAEEIAAGTRRQLLADGSPGTFALRASRPEEPWEPVVAVVVRNAIERGEITALDDLARGGGAAVITDRPMPAAHWTLTAVTATRWRLDPIGIELDATGLAADELADLGALLTDAELAPPEPVDAEPVHAEPVHVEAASAAPDARSATASPPVFAPAASALTVRVLGPVDVVTGDGTSVEFTKGKALELVVWLAHHRTNPLRLGARTAMWQADVRDNTFLTIVSEARRALARAVPPPDGTDWIARSGGDQLPLHALVGTDADELAARRAVASRQPDALAIDTLRAGLALVRGAPFDGALYLWPDGEGLPSALTHLVTSAATELAERYLAVGDLDGVLWATGRGLAALPGHDELVCLRMRAQAHAGNLAAVRAEFESYERVVGSDDWGDGEPSAEVVALRNELLGARAR